jgi:hypothetical protein
MPIAFDAQMASAIMASYIGTPVLAKECAIGSKPSHLPCAELPDQSTEECQAFLRIGMAFFREKCPEDGQRHTLMHPRQAAKISGKTSYPPRRAISGERGGRIREERHHPLREQSRVAVDRLEESLEPSRVGLDLSTASKGRGKRGEIDGVDFAHAHHERSEALNTGELPVGNVECEDLGEHGSMLHGVISWHFRGCGQDRG